MPTNADPPEPAAMCHFCGGRIDGESIKCGSAQGLLFYHVTCWNEALVEQGDPSPSDPPRPDPPSGQTVRAIVLEIVNLTMDSAYQTQRDTGSMSSFIVDAKLPPIIEALERLVAAIADRPGVPADDEEPVTEEWWLSLPKTRQGHLLIQRYPDGRIFADNGYDAVMLLTEGTTRGQVRRLCAALGIPLAADRGKE